MNHKKELLWSLWVEDPEHEETQRPTQSRVGGGIAGVHLWRFLD